MFVEVAGKPHYEMYIDPVNFDPQLTPSIMGALRVIFGGPHWDIFVIHDVALSVREILDNLCRHSDWTAMEPPSLRIWYEEFLNARYINIYASNPIPEGVDRDALAQWIAILSDPKRAQALLEDRLVLADPSSEAMRREVGGLGLVQIALLERSHLIVEAEKDRFEVHLQMRLSDDEAAGDLGEASSPSEIRLDGTSSTEGNG